MYPFSNQIIGMLKHHLKKSENRTDDSYEEQKLAIETTIDAIDLYRNTLHQSFVKHIGILGFPGGGKTW